MLGIAKYFGLSGSSLNFAISFIAGLDFLLVGYDQGVTGGLLDLPSFTKYFPEIDTLPTAISTLSSSTRSVNQGITVSSYNLGCFVGSIITIFIGNPLGRRLTIFYGCVILVIGVLLQCTSYSLPQLIAGRIVTGIGNGLNTSTVPIWQSETAQAHDRGRLVMIEGMLLCLGIAISNWINYGMAYIGENEVAWRFPLAFQIFFALIILGAVPNLPESPRWLVLQGRDDEALDILAVLADKPRDDPAVNEEFDIVRYHAAEMSKGTYRSLFAMTENREFHRVVLAYMNQVFQQISGINIITYYAPTLYGKINLPPGNYAKLIAACSGTECWLATIPAIFIVEKAGRRVLMLFGAVGMCLAMVALAITLKLLDDGYQGAGPAQAVFLFVFNGFFCVGWMGMTWLYPAEIVPLRIRAPTNALSASANWIFNFMVVMVTPVAFNNIGYKTYVIFAVTNFLLIPTVYFLYPETRRRSLEEIDDIFRKSSSVFDVVEISLKEPYRYQVDGSRKTADSEDNIEHMEKVFEQ